MLPFAFKQSTRVGQYFRVLSAAAIQNGGLAARGHDDFPHVWTQSQHSRLLAQVSPKWIVPTIRSPSSWQRLNVLALTPLGIEVRVRHRVLGDNLSATATTPDMVAQLIEWQHR